MVSDGTPRVSFTVTIRLYKYYARLITENDLHYARSSELKIPYNIIGNTNIYTELILY